MDWKQYVSVAALVLSVVSFALTYRLSAQSAVTSVRPVLVFEYSQNNGWSVRNVGSGPALNVVVAMKAGTSDWSNPVRIPPLSKDGQFRLTWIADANVKTLGASYVDVLQRKYSSSCTDDLSKAYEGNLLKEWDEAEISRHWQYKQQERN